MQKKCVLKCVKTKHKLKCERLMYHLKLFYSCLPHPHFTFLLLHATEFEHLQLHNDFFLANANRGQHGGATDIVAASQLQDPELRLLPVWSLTCSYCV